jgi:type I restriction enzyme S subunit
MNNTITLGDVAEITMGQSPPSSTYNIKGHGIPFFQGKADFGEVHPATRVWCTAPNKLGHAGDILISVRAPVGPTNVTVNTCCLGRGLAAIRPRPGADRDYLWYFLQANERKLASIGRGSTFEAISRDDLETLLLPDLPLSMQRQVAEALSRTDKLRRTHRYALDLCDEFLPATFLQMFGDPVRNTLGWDLIELGDIASVDRGKFTPRPRNDPSYYGGRYPFIQTGDITDSRGYLRMWTQTLNEKGIAVSRSFPPGTIVIAIVGATIGMTAILEVEVYCPDSVVGIQVDAGTATKEYVHSLLQIWRPVFLSQAPETARPNINLDTLRPLRVPLPPLPLQQRFSEIVQRQRRVRGTHAESLRQADHLFQTLLHQAFN